MRKYRIEIKWAIIFSVVMILWMLGEKFLGLHDEYIADHSFYTSFFAIVAIGIYLLALFDKRKNYHNGFMSWQEGFKSGAILTAGIVILSPFVQLLIIQVITPDYFRNITEYSVEAGEMNREEAELYFSLKNYIMQSMVWAAITGLITAAIAALILRRKIPNPNQVKGTTPYR
ncbi:DUF4199 domain-containing protein [Salinimicrobium sediminilitoris]|uniref:DUF4199 domain-containing protein n=1 Tax=Salinimicrobium sediminilitoris TaxID=2876715 RepID=UPI001E4AF264|nr:DUF4199 domain-containing protein [Salinimicrobium sediminilitoris]MCC8358492.1 DUF4199 domain-containing protein [Salinimicrobium sediminilitoris]